jgi:hypothetical protein
MNKIKLLTLSIFIFIGCRNNSQTHTHPKQGNVFLKIEDKLNAIAKSHGTTVETTGGGSSFDEIIVPKEKIQFRKIIWIDGNIGKAIIINPNFQNRNIDTPDWDFVILAWQQDGGSKEKGRPFWEKRLLQKVNFVTIEKNIDQLLQQAIEKLSSVKKTDLGYNSE